MKLEVELPKDTMCVFVSYIYHSETGMVMGSTAVDGDDLLTGKLMLYFNGIRIREV